MSSPRRYKSPDEHIDELVEENVKLQDQIKLLQNAIVKSVSWCDRAEHERQQSGPVLRDYLCHARNAALDGLAAVPVKTPASA